MHAHDLHSKIKVQRGISPVAVGTTGTGQTGKVIDRLGFGGLEFVIGYGAITATGAVFTVTVKEGDATGSLTSVADDDLVGTESEAGLAAANPRVSGTSKLVSKKIGYKGSKRYVQVNIKSTATAGTPVSATAILFNPESVEALG